MYLKRPTPADTPWFLLDRICIVPCQLLLLLPENPTGWPDWNPTVPSISNLAARPVCPRCAALQIIDIACQTLGERTAGFSRSTEPVRDFWQGKRIITALEKKLMKCFTLFLLLLSLCSTAELCCRTQRWAPQGGGEGHDLSSSCNSRLRLLFFLLACYVTQVPALRQQQVHMCESLSHYPRWKHRKGNCCVFMLSA